MSEDVHACTEILLIGKDDEVPDSMIYRLAVLIINLDPVRAASRYIGCVWSIWLILQNLEDLFYAVKTAPDAKGTWLLTSPGSNLYVV